MVYKVELDVAGRTLSFETGKLAKQAGGAVMARYADTVVMATATCSENAREGIDFFPLMVDYDEKLYAAGKIPGGFIKREGKPSEKSILTGRLIDRPIRPLFPKGFRHDVQICGMALSSDMENDPDVVAINASSAALAVSDIPFPDLIGAVRIGYLNDKFIVNPTFTERKDSLLNLVVAGTNDNIVMVEAGAKEVSEALLIEALKLAHSEIKKIIASIDDLQKQAGKPKRDIPVYEPNARLEEVIKKYMTQFVEEAMAVLQKTEREAILKEKATRQALIDILTESEEEDKEALIEMLKDSLNADFEYVIKKIEERIFRSMVVEKHIRPDGRKLDEIRPLSAEVGILPRAHGTGLFTRGQTQVMTILTLGTIGEGQVLDGIGGEESKRYMHQYNFPPFSVGEVKPMRGPGRREIGHGALAERALAEMIPSVDDFPYAIRLVSEVMESNGSTSMASVCGSTLALMDAGVKIKAPIAGIAMGLVTHKDGFVVLTDIQGLEDFLGDMDFKVAGSAEGVTALQMDIKIKGLSFEIMEQALAQAKKARLQVLDTILACIPEPREELSPYAPRIIVMHINPEKIKDVIGPGGKMINKIIAETGVKIDIEDDGRVFIAASSPESGEAARKMIDNLTREIAVGEIYLGRVSRFMSFGAFVEILPGKEGLVHVSQIADKRISKAEDVFEVGQEIPVKVIEIDDQGRINLSTKGLIEVDSSAFEPSPERKPREERRPDKHSSDKHSRRPRREE